MTTIDISLAPAEIAAHMTDERRLQNLTNTVAATALNKPVTTKYKAGLYLVDVLRDFSDDRAVDTNLSTLAGCMGEHPLDPARKSDNGELRALARYVQEQVA
ncbi:hypothetical protein ONR75_18600 [Rhodopseudomonas sp. P2A-2r]|uniref:hypothetical protein n=1 Tax=Rhodopseudomonas sp. P2A-2r TaxID=2991972 RepID=UPI002234E9D9|nr:hypothetical protein [Rhodopseudomonas sp. P2A-2r]UZE47015.1 hypothetical protein ONR75_18600 [Rhodopseudomonas sp. P2A-2r]